MKLLLLVEDNEDDIFITRHIIDKVCPNCDIKIIVDGEEAIELLFGTNADFVGGNLILLDINLPKVSGLDILRRIKNDPRLRHLPVVILTSSTYTSDRQKAEEYGADMYVTKPLGLDEFEAAIRRIFAAFIFPKDDATPGQ